MGTSQDQLDLLDGDDGKLAELEQAVARHLGFENSLGSVGQVYPRSLDLDVVASLVQCAAGPSSLATSIRLMAGNELVTEGFAAGQVGSSAMPHKMNTRSCERINGLMSVLRGHLTMAAALAGDQWNEGDVSCSVVRRVVLPDAFFAADGVFQTLLTVLDELGAYPAVIARELDRYLPFLTTTKVLMAAVKAGVGREIAHEAIKEHAVAVALELREKAVEGNDLLDRLAAEHAIAGVARGPRWHRRRSALVHRRRGGAGARVRAAGRRRRAAVSRGLRVSTGGDPVGALRRRLRQRYLRLWIATGTKLGRRHELSRLVFDRDGPWIRDRNGALWAYRPAVGTFGLLEGGLWEPGEVDLLSQHLTAGGVFIDVGAGIGTFSVELARRIPELQVHAFEPVDQLREALLANVAKNNVGQRVQVSRSALLDRSGRVPMTNRGMARITSPSANRAKR